MNAIYLCARLLIAWKSTIYQFGEKAKYLFQAILNIKVHFIHKNSLGKSCYKLQVMHYVITKSRLKHRIKKINAFYIIKKKEYNLIHELVL